MVPDPRPFLRHHLVRPFRRSRALALALGVATGILALAAAVHYAHVSLYEHLLLPLGVGGFVYYVAHYDLGDWEQDATLRAFLRSWAIGLLATSVVTEAESLADGLVTTVTVFGVVFFAIVTAVVDVVGERSREEGDTGGNVSAGDAAATSRPASWDRSGCENGD